MSSSSVISHAFVLPDRNFYEWLDTLRPYLAKFERVAVVRSPAGNNLNRFRDVTAVNAPLTWWQDSALTHIRRVYPSVVLVDVIDVSTPEALAPIIARRVENDDRYGQLDTEPQHIFYRFVLEWMTSARPMAVLDRFNEDSEKGDLRRSLDIATSANANVICGAAGAVTAVGEMIQVSTMVEGRQYVTTYEGVKDASVSVGDEVELGQALAKAAGERLSITVQNPPNGASLLGWDNLMNPRDYVYIPQFRARPLVDGLNVRKLPSGLATLSGASTAGTCWSHRNITEGRWKRSAPTAVGSRSVPSPVWKVILPPGTWARLRRTRARRSFPVSIRSVLTWIFSIPWASRRPRAWAI